MYYEEKIINGVLCKRYMPNKRFVPLNPEELTKKLVEIRTEMGNIEQTSFKEEE